MKAKHWREYSPGDVFTGNRHGFQITVVTHNHSSWGNEYASAITLFSSIGNLELVFDIVDSEVNEDEMGWFVRDGDCWTYVGYDRAVDAMVQSWLSGAKIADVLTVMCPTG